MIELGSLLIELGYVTKEDVQEAIIIQQRDGGMLGIILLSMKKMEPEQLMEALKIQSERIKNHE